MDSLSSTLSNRLSRLKVSEQKSRITTSHQVEAFDTAELLGIDIKKQKKELGILLRFSKTNPGVFSRTKLYMYGLKKDGQGSKVCIAYFLAMYKIFNKESKDKKI